MVIQFVFIAVVAFMAGVIAANQTQIIKNMRTIRRNAEAIRSNAEARQHGLPKGYKSDHTANELQEALTLWTSGREGMNPSSPTMLVKLPQTVTRQELQDIIQSMRTPDGTLGY